MWVRRDIPDETIATRLQDTYKLNPKLKGYDFKIRILKGRVRLLGFVHGEDEKALAGMLAKNMEGVEEVINSIVAINNGINRKSFLY